MSRLQAGLDRLRPWLARAVAIGRSIAARLAGIDAVPLLIGCADRIEAGFRWTLRLGVISCRAAASA